MNTLDPYMVRLTGLEPVRINREILSLLRLPITPQSHKESKQKSLPQNSYRLASNLLARFGGDYWDRTSRATKGGGFTIHCITIDASSPFKD